jgi:trk system potassium uptake protein
MANFLQRMWQRLWQQVKAAANNNKTDLTTEKRPLSIRYPQHGFVVIGLGRFGSSVAKTLVREGHDVLAIDGDEQRVRYLSHTLPNIVQLDATDADALQEIGIENFDTGLVSIGMDFESNLLATVLLLRFGVRRVIVKARTRTQKSILEMVGAHEVILPEQEAGEHLGRRLAFKHIVEYLEIFGGIGVVEVLAPPSLWNHSLVECNLRQRSNLTVIAVRRGPDVIVNPTATFRIVEGDILVVVGQLEDAEKLKG